MEESGLPLLATAGRSVMVTAWELWQISIGKPLTLCLSSALRMRPVSPTRTMPRSF